MQQNCSENVGSKHCSKMWLHKLKILSQTLLTAYCMCGKQLYRTFFVRPMGAAQGVTTCLRWCHLSRHQLDLRTKKKKRQCGGVELERMESVSPAPHLCTSAWGRWLKAALAATVITPEKLVRFIQPELQHRREGSWRTLNNPNTVLW